MGSIDPSEMRANAQSCLAALEHEIATAKQTGMFGVPLGAFNKVEDSGDMWTVVTRLNDGSESSFGIPKGHPWVAVFGYLEAGVDISLVGMDTLVECLALGSFEEKEAQLQSTAWVHQTVIDLLDQGHSPEQVQQILAQQMEAEAVSPEPATDTARPTSPPAAAPESDPWR